MNKERIRELLGPDTDDLTLSAHCRLIEKLPPELKNAIDEFLKTGRYPDFSVGGWTVEKVMNHTGYNVIRSFELMETLMNNPEYLRLFGNMCFGRK